MCCSSATWKRETVTDHKFDFIDVKDFRSDTIGTRLQYLWLWILGVKSVAVYIADVYTAIALLASNRWSNSILQSDAAKSSTTLQVPFTIGKWVFTGCIILSFLLLLWEARKARAIIKSRDISYAFTNVMSQDYYSMRSYDHFCFFTQINDSKKKKDEFAFFIFFTFKGWKRLLLADAPRQVINGITLYSFGVSEGWSTDFYRYYGGSILKAGIIITMLFTLVIWVGSAILLLVAAFMYVPLLCYIQGNLKEYCCHKVDKRISELMKRKNRKRLAREAEIMRKEAAGDFSHLKDKKGKITAPLPQPTLPKIGLDDYAPSYAGSDGDSIRGGSIRKGGGGNYQYPPSSNASSYGGGNGGNWERKGVSLHDRPLQTASALSRPAYPHNTSEPESLRYIATHGRGGYAESVSSFDGFAGRGAGMGYGDSSTSLHRPALERNYTNGTSAPSYRSEYNDGTSDYYNEEVKAPLPTRSDSPSFAGAGRAHDPYARSAAPYAHQEHNASESSLGYMGVEERETLPVGNGYGGGGNGVWDEPAHHPSEYGGEPERQSSRTFVPREDGNMAGRGAAPRYR